MTAVANEETKRILTTNDVDKCMWIYYAGCELSNSYERLQSLVFCASMIPALKKLYPNKDDLIAALKRHLVFYNTEGTLGSAITGITLALEEEKAQGKDIKDSTITGIKTGLMGPIAGMGDAIIWAAVMPIIIGIFLPYAQQGSAWGGIGLIIFYPLITIVIALYITRNSYRLGRDSVTSILKSGAMKQIIFTANLIGLTMMGALSASYISISTPLVFSVGDATIVMQDILDQIVPGLLPLVAVFGMYAYLQKKGPRYNTILIFVVIFSLICSFLGIL